MENNTKKDNNNEQKENNNNIISINEEESSDDEDESQIIYKLNTINDDKILKIIKDAFFDYIVDIINKNLINNNYKLIPSIFIIRSNKIINYLERAFDMRISDILYEAESLTDFWVDQFVSSEIINIIYREKKERKVIKIFELTFEELFNIFRRKIMNSKGIKKLDAIKAKIKGLDLLESDNYKDVDYHIKRYMKKEDEDSIGLFKIICCKFERFIKIKGI